jgi:hypothetical protein
MVSVSAKKVKKKFHACVPLRSSRIDSDSKESIPPAYVPVQQPWLWREATGFKESIPWN